MGGIWLGVVIRRSIRPPISSAGMHSAISSGSLASPPSRLYSSPTTITADATPTTRASPYVSANSGPT